MSSLHSTTGAGINHDEPSTASDRPSIDNTSRASVGDSHTEYPPQLHAGKVGYGPAYHTGPTLGDKIKGFEEEVKGKLTHNRAMVERGHERITGELKKKERERDMDDDPFQSPEEKKAQQQPGRASTGHAQGSTEQPATVAPQASPTADVHKKGEVRVTDDVKHIG